MPWSLRGRLLGRTVGEDLPPVLVEPGFRLEVVGPALREECPERRPVMELGEMTDLVHDDVVEDVLGREHEPPVETQRPFARARSPTAALVAQRDPRVANAEREGFRLREQRDAGDRLP